MRLCISPWRWCDVSPPSCGTGVIWRPHGCNATKLLIVGCEHSLDVDWSLPEVTDVTSGSSESDFFRYSPVTGSSKLASSVPQVGVGPIAASSDRQVSLSEDSSSRNLKAETLLALVELGVIAAVFMMVAAVYIAMIGAEAGLGKMKRAYRRRFGSPDDEERCAVLDPAARVGTFKRYKN